MAAVVISMTAADPFRENRYLERHNVKHPKLVIRGVTSKAYVTVPYAPSTGTKAGLSGSYTRQNRPGRSDLVIRQYEPTPTLALDLYFAHPDYMADVETDVQHLEAMGGRDEAVVLSGCSPTWAGPWYISDLSVESAELQPWTNKITRATYRMTLTAATDVHLPVGPTHGGVKPTTTKPPAKKPPPAKSKAKPKYYVVKRGDTLSGIAAKVLHHANMWGRIASLNHIRDPRKLKVGQRLRMP